MLVSEAMVKDPVRVTPGTSIREVARLMRDRSIGSVILVEDDKPVGIVTERDLVRRVLASDRNPDSLKASDICTKSVVTTSALADVGVAVDIMNDYNIRRLVVVDDRSGKVVGILTTDDIWQNFRRMSEELAIKYMIMRRRREG
jgi:CBS domain-containing protein